jgi:septin family protein
MVFKVGLAGPGKVGKSTTAKNLVKSIQKQYPSCKVTNYAFAKMLYDVASLLSDIPVDVLKDEHNKEVPWTSESSPIPSLVGWTPRKFLQIIGTECFRNNVCNSFWIETTMNKIKDYDIAIIEDARFPNEYETCDLVIELKRDGVEYARNHLSAMPPDEHFIWRKIELTRNMSYDELAADIYVQAQAKMLQCFK